MVLHGGEIEWLVSEKYGIPMSKITSFANTVSPFIPKEVRHLGRRFDQLFLYPPRDPAYLRSIVSRYEKVDRDRVILGSGSTELIHLFARVFCQGEVVLPIPTYSEYEEAIRNYGGEPKFIRPREDFDLDVERIVTSITNRTRAVFVCNPNNPTGLLFPRDALIAIAEAAKKKGSIFFIDEVYMCFAPQFKAYTLTELIGTYPIFVLNSISKLFGVPSLRLGWGVASRETLLKMARFKSPGTISNLSIWAAEEMLLDKSYQHRINSFISKERERLGHSLERSGMVRPLRSDCNFILSKVSRQGWNSTRLFETLARRGVVIRDCASIRGLGDRYIRTTVRTEADNRKLIQELESLRS